ncbi:unnamed protein product [Calicophoron daubneyi]|uniref:Uncharacterized protein n=1 Tax=Calicophoron daubneyi TaxID=300641 RepID=A0AAV2SZ37_CALDB
MCEVERMLSGCGNYTDVPSHWGTETKDPDETLLLTLGIMLDLGIGAMFLGLTGLKFGEEIRYWMRTRVGRLAKPYERVADYLRSSELTATVPEVRERIPQPSMRRPETVEEFEEDDLSEHAPFVVHSKTTAKKTHKKKSKRLIKKKTKPSLSTSVEKTPEKQPPVALETRIRYRPTAYKASSTFLPISKAKPVERVLSSSDSGSSSSPYTATSIIGIPRPMPKWNPVDE